jgi:hypothetical protein
MRKGIAVITVTALILICSMAALSEAQPIAQPAVGVKPGEWMEYHVVVGGHPPAAQDITWAKIEILDVEGELFHANFTVRYVNGTVSSNVGSFNFASGNTGSWVIIPANLSPGQSFYDKSTGNGTIQGQLQKTVAGAIRTITYTNFTINGVALNKQWDKATGFYVQSADIITTAAPATVNGGLAYTINARAYATNIWSPQILGLNQTVFYIVIIIVIVAVALTVSVLVLDRRRKKVS